MNTKLLTVLGVLLVLGAAPLLLSAESDAMDPPTEYDERYDFSSRTYYTDSAAEVIHFADGDSTLSDIGMVLWGANHSGSLEIVSSYLPTWIVFDYGTSLNYDVTVTITPGAVCDDVFWILFKCYGSPLLITFDITVLESDSGEVVPGEDYNQFTLYFDCGEGSSVSPMYGESADSFFDFDVSGVVSVRDGYVLKGWSSDASGQAMFEDTITVTLADGASTGSLTVYAVWEQSTFTIPTFWDGLMELVSNPLIFLLGMVLFLSVCLFIRNRTRGYA